MLEQLRRNVQHTIVWLRRVATEPRTELTRWQRTARFGYDLGRFGAKQLRNDRTPQMAAALSFRTLFSLLPVLVVATVLVRAVLGADEFVDLVRKILEAMGLYDIGLATEIVDFDTVRVKTLGGLLEPLVTQAGTFNFTAIGWVGLAVLVYSAIGLMVTIENSFNIIYRAPEGRSWTRRVPMYWFVLTVGPVAVALTIFLDAQFARWIGHLGALEEGALRDAGSLLVMWQTVLQGVVIVWSFFLTWLMIFAVYMLVPNAPVSMRPTLTGAFVATVLLTIGRSTLGAYMQNLVSLRQLYGSLGLIPIFMFWLYVMWLFILFGLEVAATLQSLKGRQRLEQFEQEQHASGLIDPTAVLAIMEVIAERFGQAKPATTPHIAEATRVPQPVVSRMLQELCDRGFVHKLGHPENAVALARPPEDITAEQLIEVGYSMVQRGDSQRHAHLLERFREAQRHLASQITLAGLLRTPLAAEETAGPT